MLLTMTDAAGSLKGAGFASAAKRHFRRHRRKLAIAAALAEGARGVHHRNQRRVVNMGAPIGTDWIDVNQGDIDRPDIRCRLVGK